MSLRSEQRHGGAGGARYSAPPLCVCLCVWSHKDKEAEPAFGTSRRRVMGSFSLKGWVGGHGNGHSGGIHTQLVGVLPLCLVCLSGCLSVSPLLHSLPQKPQDGSNLEIGSATNKAELQRAEAGGEGRGGRREWRREQGTSIWIWKVVGKCRACIFKKALLERARGEYNSWQ